MTVRTREIVDFDFDVTADYYPIPLHHAGEVDSVRWAREIVDDVEKSADAPVAVGDIVENLVELRRRLLAQGDEWMTASVSIRPEVELSIGCLLTAEQFTLDEGEGPDAFEEMLRSQSEQMVPGTRSQSAEFWRGSCDAGEIVGMFQRLAVRELGEAEGRLEQRTVFGVFPPDSIDMVRFIFTVADLGVYLEMPKQTQAMVETLRVRTKALV